MIDKTISPLRQRMIEDMTVRHFKEKVQKDYIRHVKNFTVFLGRSPDTATSEDLRLFQLHMTRNQVSAASVNCAIVALRFFFKVTLERADLVQRLTFVREPRKAPIVLSGTPPRGRARRQIQGGAWRRLRRRLARVRGR
jgi:integrase/recombinase XerD